MKKLLTASATAALILTTSALPALAAKGPAQKATGGVRFEQPAPYNNASMEFEVHDADEVGKTDKGSLRYADEVGYYVPDVYKVDVLGDNADFWGKVTESTHPGVPVGANVNIRVHDGGEPGTNGDLINGAVGVPAPAPSIPVTGGNLQVHS